jgi:hypothetical protein
MDDECPRAARRWPAHSHRAHSPPAVRRGRRRGHMFACLARHSAGCDEALGPSPYRLSAPGPTAGQKRLCRGGRAGWPLGRWAANARRRPSPVAVAHRRIGRRPPSLPRHGQPPGLASTMPADSDGAAAVWHSLPVRARRVLRPPPAARRPPHRSPPLAQGRPSPVRHRITVLYMCRGDGTGMPEPREPWPAALARPGAPRRRSACQSRPDGVMCFASRSPPR